MVPFRSNYLQGAEGAMGKTTATGATATTGGNDRDWATAATRSTARRGRPTGSATPGVRQLALDVAFGVAFLDLAAPIVELLALAEPELQLRLAARGDV